MTQQHIFWWPIWLVRFHVRVGAQEALHPRPGTNSLSEDALRSDCIVGVADAADPGVMDVTARVGDVGVDRMDDSCGCC